MPKFTYDAELKLQQANAAFQADGTLLNPHHKLKSSILDGLAEEIVKYKVYLSDAVMSFDMSCSSKHLSLLTESDGQMFLVQKR